MLEWEPTFGWEVQKDRHQWFLSSWDSSFLYLLVWWKSENGDRSEKGNGSWVTAACLSPPVRSSQIADCYTGQLVYAECGTR